MTYTTPTLTTVMTATLCFGCVQPQEARDSLQSKSHSAEILAIGDSFLTFNAPGMSIPEVAASLLDATVDNDAVGGETLLGGGKDSIPNQYIPGGYKLLIASGGGNDLGERCSCGFDCQPVLDQLISEDSSGGAIVELVERAIEDECVVAWVGYMVPTDDAEAFSGCDEELDTMRERLHRLDEREEMMIFVDGASIGTGREEALYKNDGHHPSTLGSEAIGESLAEAIFAYLDD